MIAIDRSAPVPERAADYAGLCLMGGPMSVNDPLAWIAPLSTLIRDAAAHDIPLIGHCLGGQLISRALGGEVTRGDVKELGWGSAHAEDNADARRWLGDCLAGTAGVAQVFQWHGETFSLPPGAQRILANDYCTNQAFALGPHLALQCHVEMSAEMIESWCAAWPDEVAGMVAARLPPCIQTPQQMLQETAQRLPAMRRLADQLYTVWIGGLARA